MVDDPTNERDDCANGCFTGCLIVIIVILLLGWWINTWDLGNLASIGGMVFP